jgi:hypothetical protein
MTRRPDPAGVATTAITNALVTDGLLEFGERPYSDGARLYEELANGDLPARAAHLMQTVHRAHGADSATLVTWDAHAGDTLIQPSK